MKKRILLFTVVATLSYATLSSYSDGPAQDAGLNRTGAQGSLTTCGGGGCHGTGVGPIVTITVDSGTTAVTHYKPGMSYIIKLHGAGSTNTSFGFQFASVSGSGTTQIKAGTSHTFPTGVHSSTLYSLQLIEQSNALAATSAGVYDESFSWTAPATAVGNITLYCTINAVNGDGSENAADVSGNTSITLTPTASTTAVANIAADMSVKAFPNPTVNNLNLQLDNAQSGNYSVEVFNLGGKVIAKENISVNGTSQTASINTGNWAPGTYMVAVEKDGISKVIPVVKQ